MTLSLNSPETITRFAELCALSDFHRKDELPDDDRLAAAVKRLRAKQRSEGNLDKMWEELDAPTLELPESAQGGTGYIDSLKPEDMTAPVMKGIDGHDRKFIAVCMQEGLVELNEETNELELRMRPYAAVEVFFQRYTEGAQGVWVSGGDHNFCTSASNSLDRRCLKDLLEHGHVMTFRVCWGGGYFCGYYEMINPSEADSIEADAPEFSDDRGMY